MIPAITTFPNYIIIIKRIMPTKYEINEQQKHKTVQLFVTEGNRISGSKKVLTEAN